MAFPRYYLDPRGVLWEVRSRTPYVIPGEIPTLVPGVAGANVAFPGNSPFTHNVSQPFEIHDIIPRAYVVDAVGTPLADPVPDINAFWQLSIRQEQYADTSVLRAAQRVDALVDRFTRIWHLSGPENSDPTYFEKSQGWNVTATSLIPVGGNNLTVDLSLRGYLLALGERVAQEEPLRQERTRYDDAPFAPQGMLDGRPEQYVPSELVASAQHQGIRINPFGRGR